MTQLELPRASGEFLSRSVSRRLEDRRRNKEPLETVLTHLSCKKKGMVAPPFIPRFAPLPISDLCQLSLLWALAGEQEAAERLASSLPLDFPWIWCKEGEYDEKEAALSVAMLRRAFGLEQKIEMDAGVDPFFHALFKKLPRLERQERLAPPILEVGRLRATLCFEGECTSLGAILSPRVEVRAFGPQAFPLSVSSGFGIRPIKHHQNRWGSPFAMPDVWFEAKMRAKVPEEMIFDLSFIGLKLDAPLAFSFYVHADSAQVGGVSVKTKSLERYFGDAQPVLFGSNLEIKSDSEGKMEVIPLAGSGCFWDCEYLLAFEIHPLNSKCCFSVSLIDC